MQRSWNSREFLLPEYIQRQLFLKMTPMTITKIEQRQEQGQQAMRMSLLIHYNSLGEKMGTDPMIHIFPSIAYITILSSLIYGFNLPF